MHLKSIELKNTRGLGHGGKPLKLELAPRDGTLAGWTVVVGPNGAGKSTLLRAIALACAGPRVMEHLQPKSKWWLSNGARKGHVSVGLMKGHYDEWYLEDENFHGVGVKSSGTHRIEYTMEPKIGVRLKGLSDSEHRPEYGPWISFGQPPGWFIAGYGAFRRLTRGARESEHFLESSKRSVAQLASLFREDIALLEPMEWLEKLDYAARFGRQDEGGLRSKVLGLLSAGLLPNSAKIVGISPDGLEIRESGKTFTLNNLSDGYQTVIALVLDIVRNLDRSYAGLTFESGAARVLNEGIVLIDEVDAHLHPEWQKRIGAWFVEHFPNIQFIVSTHSPFICQDAATGCVIRLAGPGDDRPSRVLDRDELDRLLLGTADNIYLSDAFGIDSTRGSFGRDALKRLSRLEVSILDETATPADIAEYKVLKRLVPANSELLAQLRAIEHRS